MKQLPDWQSVLPVQGAPFTTPLADAQNPATQLPDRQSNG
jgi:hypothetical protein